METKKGFIIKSTINGRISINHLLPDELHLIKQILKDADNNRCEILETTFTSENDFITQLF